MKIVRTFATSANIGPGFDTLGICYDVYNEYSFKKSDKFTLYNFKSEFSYPDSNLIIYSYKKTFQYLNKELIYISLKEEIQNIPESRGMGSSASCIVAGVLIANEILNNVLSKDEIFNIAASIEGHPDNVAPLIFGGFTSSYKSEKFYTNQLEVNKDYKFLLLIPPFKLSTKKAREVLPKQIEMHVATSNIANTISTIEALKNGDINQLIRANNDLLHEPYRLPLIENAKIIKNIAKENNASAYISGAGPTMLVISKSDVCNKFELENWKKITVNINNKGAYVYEK